MDLQDFATTTEFENGETFDLSWIGNSAEYDMSTPLPPHAHTHTRAAAAAAAAAAQRLLVRLTPPSDGLSDFVSPTGRTDLQA